MRNLHLSDRLRQRVFVTLDLTVPTICLYHTNRLLGIAVGFLRRALAFLPGSLGSPGFRISSEGKFASISEEVTLAAGHRDPSKKRTVWKASPYQIAD